MASLRRTRFKVQQIAVYLLLLALTCGFRVFYNQNWWNISQSDPTVWLKFCAKDVDFSGNSLSGDPLLPMASPTFDQVVSSVMEDFNQIPTSFVRLELYPDDAANPAAGSSFTTDKASSRTIDICFENRGNGIARSSTLVNGKVSSCTIRLGFVLKTDLKGFVTTLTHELGHCLGLDHSQETVHAIMSYFSEVKGFTRLQMDDTLGMTFLYPTDPSYGHETPTYGVSCSPKPSELRSPTLSSSRF